MSDANRFSAEVVDPSGLTNHASTYASFLRFSVALCLACFIILVALAMFAFGPSGALVYGFGGLIVGLVALIIDLRSGSNLWLLSGGFSVLFALFTAMMVS